MRFADRNQAGKQLAHALTKYAGRSDVTVVGLPRGGVVVAAEVARALDLPLDIVVPRKLGHELNPEYAIGAIAETGQAVWNEIERAAADPAYLTAIMATERAEATRRLVRYRAGRPDRDFRGKTIIIVDDGVATGYTVEAAIAAAQTLGARRIIVAVPRGAPDSLARIRTLASEVVVLNEPDPYYAVGVYYKEFPQVSDEEVVHLLGMMAL